MRRGKIAAGVAIAGIVAAAVLWFLPLRRSRPPVRQVLLERQNAALRTLTADAERGKLLDFKGLLIVVDQTLVQDLLRAVTPLSADVGGGFHLTITDVESAFGDGVALVRFVGQAKLGERSVGTEVKVFAAIDVVTLDPVSGVMRCGVSILGVEAENASALGRRDPIDRLTEALASGGLALLLGPLEIPVRIEDRLSIPAVESKRLQIPAENLPLTVSAQQVKVFAGRLWVFVDVALAPAPGRTNAGKVPEKAERP